MDAVADVILGGIVVMVIIGIAVEWITRPRT